eukprot:11083580-Prorocentrum_lima.AAC.1
MERRSAGQNHQCTPGVGAPREKRSNQDQDDLLRESTSRTRSPAEQEKAKDGEEVPPERRPRGHRRGRPKGNPASSLGR